MSHYDWTPTTQRERSSTGAVLEAETEGAIIRFHLDDRDDEVRPAFTVETGGRICSTDDPKDWPTIERYVPRAEWPDYMYAGRGGPAERTPDRAVVEAILEYEAALREAQTTTEEVEAAAAAYEAIETAAAAAGRAESDLVAAVQRGIDLGMSDRVLATASGWSRSTVRRLRGHAG